MQAGVSNSEQFMHDDLALQLLACIISMQVGVASAGQDAHDDLAIQDVEDELDNHPLLAQSVTITRPPTVGPANTAHVCSSPVAYSEVRNKLLALLASNECMLPLKHVTHLHQFRLRLCLAAACATSVAS